MHQYPKVKMSFSTTSFQHSVLLWTRTPSVPSAQQPAVLLLQSLFSSVVSASFGCHSPSRHYCEVLCLPTAHARCGVCSETSPSERIPVCRETSGAVCSLCFSLGFFNPVLSNLNRKCFYFFSNYYDWAFFPWVVFWFFFFAPSLILAVCTASLIQWSAGFVWSLHYRDGCAHWNQLHFWIWNVLN